MYEKFIDLLPYIIVISVLGGIGAVGFLFCLGPAWAFNTRMSLRIQAILLDCRATVLLHQHINKAPKAIISLAVFQFLVIAGITCVTCASTFVDAPHVTGSLILGSFAIWAIRGAGQDAVSLIKTIESSDMMKSCLMVERESWTEQSQ